ncbi:MAG: VWA domain-containing protein [Terriglobales bacterium]
MMRWFLSGAACLLMFAATLLGQELPGTVSTTKPPVAPAAQATKAVAQIPTIVVNSDLVNMVFSVAGKHHDFIPDLPEGAFRVLEDGHPQTIKFFSSESQLPLTMGLLLDTSPSQVNVLAAEQGISDQFFRQVLTGKDLAFVLGFDINTTLLQDFTSSRDLLDAALDNAHIGGGSAASIYNPGSFPTPSSAGATHLWDAIYLACHDELAHQVGRKAIIVVTDGGEQGSTYTQQDALRAALDSNTVVFAVIAADRSYGGYAMFGPGPGPGQLAKLAEETGGASINAGSHLAEAFQQIQAALRSQYTLGYRSANPARDGKFRAVKIELTPAAEKSHSGAKVRTRTGYFAPGSGDHL